MNPAELKEYAAIIAFLLGLAFGLLAGLFISAAYMEGKQQEDQPW